MDQDILDQMAFALDLLQQDARLLDLQMLASLLSMASVELADARCQQAGQAPKARAAEFSVAPHVVGSWRWSIAEDRATLDPEVANLVGIAPEIGARGVPLALVIAAVHPADRRRVEQAFARAVSHDESIHLAFRMKPMNGTARRIFAVGRLVSENGRPSVLPGTLVDVSDRAADAVRKPRKLAAGFGPSRPKKSGGQKAWLL